MSLDIARTRTALAREIANLEECLASDANWQTLRAIEVRTGLSMPPQLDRGAALALPESLRAVLEKNPVFLARARLYEALEILLAPSPANNSEPLESVPAAVDASHRINAALARLAERARPFPPPIRYAPAAAERPVKPNEPEAAVMPEPPPVTASRPMTTPTMVEVVDEDGDDLRHIAFIDDRVAAQLNASGILRFSDIAHFTVDQVAVLSVRLGLGNRITREQWVEQAAILAAGNTTAYASQVQSGGTPFAMAGASEPDKTEPPYIDYASFDRSGQACPPASQSDETRADVASPAVVPPVPEQAVPQPVVPPPLPPACVDLPSLQVPEDHGTDFDEANTFTADDCPEVSDVWIVPRSMQAAQIQVPPPDGGAESHDVFSRQRRREDGPLLRNPRDWEPIEEAAVEIVPRLAPFPGVGPVSEAVTRLQLAVEPPAPAFSRLFRAFQRR